MKKVLVSGYIGFGNFGDEAIFYCLNKHLKSLGVEVSVLCSNPNEVKENYNVNSYYFKNPLQIIKAILNCDILYSGGGSLLQNKTSNFSLYYYLFIIILAKLFSKKIIIFSQGIEPIKGCFNTLLTKIVLKVADYITVRDNKSLELLKKWGIKADLTSDPVYSILENIEVSFNKEGLIVQLRNFKGINDEFLDNLANAISIYSGKVKVFSFQDEIDKEVCTKFIKKLTNKGIEADFIPSKNIKETIDIVNNSEYMISTRLHGIIISHALQTKTFALIYDEKIKTISDELNISSVDINNYTKEELNKKISSFFNSKYRHYPYRKFNWEYSDKIILGEK